MSLTLTNLEYFDMGNRRAAKFHVSFPDENYTTGGLSLTPGDLRMRKIDLALIESSKRGILFEYDYDNEKLMAFYPRGEVLSSLAAGIIPGETAVKSVASNGEIISLSGQAGVEAGKASEVKSDVNLVEISQTFGTALRCMFIGY